MIISSSRVTNRGIFLCAILISVSPIEPTPAQPARAAPLTSTEAPVRGIYNWIHSTGDAERAFAFYRDVFGIELAASTFAGDANAAPERIRPVSQASADTLVWDLTNTEGSRFRSVFMHAGATPYGLEVTEFFDIPRNVRPANSWDPGTSMLIFHVRDVDAIVAEARAAEGSIVTLGNAPLETPAGRSILIRDPDGYLIRVTQAPRAEINAAAAADRVMNTSIGITVADTRTALEFYRGLLGFEAGETRRVASSELRLFGLTDAELLQTAATIPGTEVTVLFSEFRLGPTTSPPAMPFRWKIQDVGSPQFQLQVVGLDALIERTKEAGYRFLSIGARPIQRPFGRFVFAIDPDGVLVEFVEPAK